MAPLKKQEPMSDAEFWKIIDSVRSKTGSGMADLANFSRVLRETLGTLGVGELVAFDLMMSDLEARAYRYDLWGAAFVINGGCSDDGFLYFRRWLIAQGRKVWDAALSDPESLATTTPPGEDAEFEELAYVVRTVFEEKTGREMTFEKTSSAGPSKPAGEDWNEEDLEDLFPKLTRKFG